MTGNTRGTLAAAALGAAVGVAAGLLLVSGLVGAPVISDTPVYQGYGERMAAGQVPYRDFRVEYPPGALPVFLLPALVTSAQDRYDEVFAGLMIASLAALAALTAVSLRLLGASGFRIGAALATLAGCVLLLGPFTLTRFDFVPALVAAAAVAMALAGYERLGAAALGVAVATKLYPAVLLPLFVARSWRRHGRVAGLRTLALTAGVTVLVYLPFAAISPGGVTRSLWQQLGRPLQIESLGSATLLALHHAFAMPLGWASGHGSQNLTGTVAAAASAATTVAGVAALVWVWVAYARGEAGGERLVRFAAAVVAFVAFGKVLSPQFLVWLLPLVPLVAGRRGAVASGLLVLACGLTRLWFPDDYWALVKQFDERASWLVLGRDLALVGLFALLVAPARSESPTSTATARAPAR
ncbi:MAG: glycosyltransferase 87 family protein [Gaiellaceae bacterium]